MDFDSFFNDRAESATPAQAGFEELTLDELPLPAEPASDEGLDTGFETGLDTAFETNFDTRHEPSLEPANAPAAPRNEVPASRAIEPDPEFNIYGEAETESEADWAATDETSSVAEMPFDTPITSAKTTAVSSDQPTKTSVHSAEQSSEKTSAAKQTGHTTAEPLSALEDLALELPDDWASLKKAPRQEPVFDDDNGLDLDERTATASKPAAKPLLGKSDKDSAPATKPLDQGKAKIEPQPELPARKPALTSAVPENASAPTKAPAPEKTAEPQTPESRKTESKKAEAQKTEPKKFGVFKADSDESFELHPDLAEFSNDQPVIGDWSLNQNETVDKAGDGDQLRQPAPASPHVMPVPAALSPAAEAAVSTSANLKNTSPKSAAKAAPDAVAIADFGDISSDWDKPSIQLQANATITATAAAEPQPEPFDSEAFTADPGSRVFQPVIDPLDDLSSDDWTLVSTEPREDYEASLFAPPPKRRFPWKGLAWTAAALLTLVLLVSQLLWPQRGELREDPQWGPWVESICQHIDCDLPPRVDVSKVQLQQKSVLKDRTDPRVLQIDLLIANKAEFSQPYPDIKLRFTNIEAEVVAERRFKPSEYLREQPDSDQMPVGVPIHIAFTVRAPDAKVTGYEFDFLPTDR